MKKEYKVGRSGWMEVSRDPADCWLCGGPVAPGEGRYAWVYKQPHTTMLGQYIISLTVHKRCAPIAPGPGEIIEVDHGV